MASGLAIIVLLLAANSGLAAARAALINASKSRLRQMKDEGRGGAALAVRVAEDATSLLATVRLAQTFCRFSVAGLVVLLFEPALAGWLRGLNWQAIEAETDLVAFFVLALPATLVIVSAGELLPEAWALRDPETAALWAAPLVAALEWLLRWPVRGLLWLSDKLSVPLTGQRVPFVTEEEIKTLVDAGEEGGVIEEGEKEMIYSVFDFGETVAREIMVPRIDVAFLAEDLSLPEVFKMVIECGHSRFPVYAQTIDNVVGILYAKDLLRYLHNGSQELDLRTLIRKSYFVPESMRLDSLLREMKRRRVHIAIVVDEYGGVSGIVCMEDILEEIIGDIQDEFDNERDDIVKLNDGMFLCDARASIDDINEALAAELPADDFDTLGGFVFDLFGKIPSRYEKVAWQDLDFIIQDMEGHKIKTVKIVLKQDQDEENSN